MDARQVVGMAQTRDRGIDRWVFFFPRSGNHIKTLHLRTQHEG